MALGPRLDLRPTQGLAMTPQLQQAIRLLQLSATDLVDYVEHELESNPLLERDDSIKASALSEAMGNDDDRSEAGTTLIDTVDNQSNAPLDIDDGFTQNDAAFDVTADAPDYADTSPILTLSGMGGDDSFPDIEGVPRKEDLRTYLESQLSLSLKDPAKRFIGTALIDSIDDNGYLVGKLEDLAHQLGAPLDAVEGVLETLQTFDPPGIFARDLKECLVLQLRDLNRHDPAMATLINNLDLLAKHDYEELMSRCSVDKDDLEEMISEVRMLDPKPALKFDSGVSQAVIPDVIMAASGSGGWRVELNTETMPRVLINNQYYSELNRAADSSTEKKFVAEQFQSATWLVRALEQRATTILKVATSLVSKQDAFFRKGLAELKPLVLRDIAEEIDMHESTVSRVTANKFIATPRGIYELKYFFSQALTDGVGGEATSVKAVRYRIKQLIGAESPDDVLSDDRLVLILRGEGISVARRTVAKYRDSLKITSSVQRRREKNRNVSKT
ncbi:MAG: RNA polymerase factor sigma-54 [Rhodospirillaceae bacterium]